MQDAWTVQWRDYYEILQINPKAESVVVTGAFTRLAQKYHPDHDGGDEAKMKLLNEAYAVLRDPAKRARYDAAFNRRNQQKSAEQKPAEPPPPPSLPAEVLTGHWWRQGDNLLHYIEQRGHLIQVRAVDEDGNVLFDGHGTFDGRKLQIAYHAMTGVALQLWQPGFAICDLSQDGHWITGPLTLFRLGFR